MERTRILDPAADAGAVRLTHGRAQQLIPALEGSAIQAAWAGYVDSTPDGVPGIGEMAELPGLILAAGFSGHGFGIGPGALELGAGCNLGAMTDERWKDYFDKVVAIKLFEPTLDYKKAYTTKFVCKGVGADLKK